MKHCTKCGQDKPLKAFALNCTRKDGFQNWCRACKRAQEALYSPRRSRPPTPPKKPHRPTGKPARPPTRRYVAHGSGGDVIEDLLRYTVWPQVMIADLAQVSTDTVSRILANSDIPRPRPAYHIRSVRAPQDLALTRRLWHHFLTERTQNGPLSALSIYRCAFKAAPAGLRVKSSTTKERLSRLKAGKSTRDLDRGTTLNEGTVLKMLPLMLIYNAMYGQLLPSPDLAGKEPNFNWVPEEHRDAFKAAVGMEVAQ